MENIQQQRREAIYLALVQIPKGKVISYGDLAKLAGLTNGARLVGKTLSNLPKGSTLPWYRVINSQGKISLPLDSPSYEKQIKNLIKEGVEVVNGRINLKRFGYHL
jgi:methylated-DNA-protein-cysteine methyltransferase-like protein